MPEEAEVIEQEVSETTEVKDKAEVVGELLEGDNGFGAFMSDEIEADYAKQEPKKEEVKAEDSKEEGSEVEIISPEDQKKIEDLLSKSEESGLNTEEIEFMKTHGYEIEEPELEESGSDNAKKDEKGSEKEEENDSIELPKEFMEDLDDFFSDDENYDPEKITVPERLQYAQKAMAKMRENQSALSKAFSESPELAGFVSDVVVNGIDPGTSAKKHFADVLEEEVPKAGTPEYDKWVIHREDQKRDKKRIQKLQQDQKDNFQLSLKKAVEFVDTHKLSDKQRKEVFEEADRRIQEMATGVIGESFYRSVMRDLNYDKDMEKAETLGKVKMANQKIKFKKRQGDGLPKINTIKGALRKGNTYDSDATKEFEGFLPPER
jgi:hypothetical protein